MKIIEELVQGSEEWFTHRLCKVTASDAKRLMTAKTCKASAQRSDVMAELIAERRIPSGVDAETMCKYTGKKFIGNVFTDHGNEMEPVARESWLETVGGPSGLTVKEVGMVVRDDDFIACSPDGLIYSGDIAISGLEIKCKCLKEHVKVVKSGELPDEHKAQCHWSMIVCGFDSWVFYSYFPGEQPFHTIVKRDDYTAKMEAVIDQFIIDYAIYQRDVEDQLLIKAPDSISIEMLVNDTSVLEGGLI